MKKYWGYELYHCKPFAGIIAHGYDVKTGKAYSVNNAPQVACFYWQVRLDGKLIDTALTEDIAQLRVKLHLLKRQAA